MKSSTLLVLYATLMYFFASTRTVQGQLSWTDLTKGGRSFHKVSTRETVLISDVLNKWHPFLIIFRIVS